MYVDDLMLSGPSGEHESFWKLLMEEVKIEDPEPLDRFLRRYHEYDEIAPPQLDIRRWFDPTIKNDTQPAVVAIPYDSPELINCPGAVMAG